MAKDKKLEGILGDGEKLCKVLNYVAQDLGARENLDITSINKKKIKLTYSGIGYHIAPLGTRELCLYHKDEKVAGCSGLKISSFNNAPGILYGRLVTDAARRPSGK